MRFPEFSANLSLDHSNHAYYRVRSSSTRSDSVHSAIDGTVYRMCCPSGDCDSTFCPNNDGAHVDCTNGKANTSCNKSCFLTTACTAARGLADDCYELQTLRQFRDSYLTASPGGQEAISSYYAIAPAICKEIALRADADAIYERIYRELVCKAIDFIRTGRLAEAFEHYRQFTFQLARESGVQAA